MASAACASAFAQASAGRWVLLRGRARQLAVAMAAAAGRTRARIAHPRGVALQSARTISMAMQKAAPTMVLALVAGLMALGWLEAGSAR